MSNSKNLINELLVELFNNILNIEEMSLIQRGIKDLSMTEVHVIDAIGKGEGKMMSEIAEKLDITMGTLTASINRLVKKNYVVRKKALQDKRIVVATLTDKGKLVYKIHQNFHEEMVDHIMVDLQLDEDEVLLKSLKKVKDFFTREYGGR